MVAPLVSAGLHHPSVCRSKAWLHGLRGGLGGGEELVDGGLQSLPGCRHVLCRGALAGIVERLGKRLLAIEAHVLDGCGHRFQRVEGLQVVEGGDHGIEGVEGAVESTVVAAVDGTHLGFKVIVEHLHRRVGGAHGRGSELGLLHPVGHGLLACGEERAYLYLVELPVCIEPSKGEQRLVEVSAGERERLLPPIRGGGELCHNFRFGRPVLREAQPEVTPGVSRGHGEEVVLVGFQWDDFLERRHMVDASRTVSLEVCPSVVSTLLHHLEIRHGDGRPVSCRPVIHSHVKLPVDDDVATGEKFLPGEEGDGVARLQVVVGVVLHPFEVDDMHPVCRTLRCVLIDIGVV